MLGLSGAICSSQGLGVIGHKAVVLNRDMAREAHGQVETAGRWAVSPGTWRNPPPPELQVCPPQSHHCYPIPVCPADFACPTCVFNCHVCVLSLPLPLTPSQLSQPPHRPGHTIRLCLLAVNLIVPGVPINLVPSRVHISRKIDQKWCSWDLNQVFQMACTSL